jgi:excisionase family DNA binding protein
MATESQPRDEGGGELIGASDASSAEPTFDEGSLSVDLQHISRATVLELMRIAAGLSYTELARSIGIPRSRLRRYLRGLLEKPRESITRQIWDALWQRLPPRSAALILHQRHIDPSLSAHDLRGLQLLTLKQAARMTRIPESALRRLLPKHPELCAVKIGAGIRIPRDTLAEFIASSPAIPTGKDASDMITMQRACELLQVEPHVLRYAIKCGRLEKCQLSKKHRIYFTLAEIRRFLSEGTAPLSDRLAVEQRYRQKRREARQQEAHA